MLCRWPFAPGVGHTEHTGVFIYPIHVGNMLTKSLVPSTSPHANILPLGSAWHTYVQFGFFLHQLYISWTTESHHIFN